MLYAIAITALLFFIWEIYWRAQGLPIAYNEDNAAWANYRAKVDAGTDPKIVLIGSSRMKFDIDLATFEDAAGVAPIQLSLHATSPLPALHDLANDSLFTGTLLIGVTEGLFFAPPFARPVTEMVKRVNYYHHWTPAQRASFGISRTLEAGLVSLDQDQLSLNALLARAPIPLRAGVFSMPVFPIDWSEVDSRRQSRLSEKLLHDKAMQDQVRYVWAHLSMLGGRRAPAGDTLTGALIPVKRSIDKLKARGVQVYFVKAPVDSPFWEGEQKAFPRNLFWDYMLEFTQTQGVHFDDYPGLKKFRCPEGSHLAPADAVPFTAELVRILKTEKGWKIPAQ